MKILFIHQNMPGQYKHLVNHFKSDPKNEVVFITNRKGLQIDGVKKVFYELKREVTKGQHRYALPIERAIIYGQEVARKLSMLKNKGFIPDVILVHPGWGEGLFIKSVYPETPVLHFCEYYYQAFGSDCFFNPREEVSLDAICRITAKNAPLMMSAEAMDWGIAPTYWQWQQFPQHYRDKISVIHDGIDTDYCHPDPDVEFKLPNGNVLTRKDEVVTYIARNLEPYRGFETFMKALQIMCKRRPNTQFLVVGADGVSYGAKLPKGDSYRKRFMKMVDIDESRVHFVGRLPYSKFQKAMRVSSAHLYLTYPFVLSWSFLEAMASECLVIGSNTGPVSEVLKDGENGFLVDFFDPKAIADKVDDVFAHPDQYDALRKKARKTVIKNYAFKDCLDQQIAIINGMAEGKSPAEFPTNHPKEKIIAPWEKPESVKPYIK
ncbi:MAG: glycosyltransferase family 4 protein [Alphaproteobacteria bacterium]